MGWVGVMFLLPMVAMSSQIPNANQRTRAIGSVASLSEVLRRAFDPAQDFEPLPAPGPNDWLAVHSEPGQSFEQWVQAQPNRPDKKRRIIYAKTLLRRSCKVLVHETGHMFGLAHCIYFRCVFNGSNHLVESDARPLHECPVDLRKLHDGIGFDVPRRYADLCRFYRKAAFDDETAWTQKRLEELVGREEAAKVINAAGERGKS